jgi:predicted metal-dependent hydrolase
MDLVREAFNTLFPEKPYIYTADISYSGKFKGYNASIRHNKWQKHLALKLSKKWQGVSRDIQLGLVQHLLVRLFKDKRKTTNIDLYMHFLKAVPRTVAKTKTHPVLAESFSRLNQQYFNGLMDQPNLVIGNGITKLGHYDIGTDTVNISTILIDHPELLDYVLYHELLHKKHQFSGMGQRHTYHSAAFRAEERAFPRAAQLEKELSRLVSAHKRKGFWGWF